MKVRTSLLIVGLTTVVAAHARAAVPDRAWVGQANDVVIDDLDGLSNARVRQQQTPNESPVDRTKTLIINNQGIGHVMRLESVSPAPAVLTPPVPGGSLHIIDIR